MCTTSMAQSASPLMKASRWNVKLAEILVVAQTDSQSHFIEFIIFFVFKWKRHVHSQRYHERNLTQEYKNACYPYRFEFVVGGLHSSWNSLDGSLHKKCFDFFPKVNCPLFSSVFYGIHGLVQSSFFSVSHHVFKKLSNSMSNSEKELTVKSEYLKHQ